MKSNIRWSQAGNRDTSGLTNYRIITALQGQHDLYRDRQWPPSSYDKNNKSIVRTPNTSSNLHGQYYETRNISLLLCFSSIVNASDFKGEMEMVH